VLLAGRDPGPGEVYNGNNDSWQNTAGTHTNYWYRLMMFAFSSGKVLLLGEALSAPGATEIYDVATGAFTAGPTMPLFSGNPIVAGFVGVQLRNGDVLVTGGHTTVATPPATTYAAVYHWATNTWSLVANGTMQSAREDHCAALLANGKVLIAGGSSGYNGASPNVTADLYDSDTDTLTAVGPHMRYTKRRAAAFALPGTAKGIVCAGRTTDLANPGVDIGPGAEIYDSALNTWVIAAPPTESHVHDDWSINQVWAAALATGAPMLIGGHNTTNTVPTATVDVIELPEIAPAGPSIVLLAISASAGPVAGGTVVTIFGTGFAENAVVLFGQLHATEVVVHNSTRLTCRTPEHVAGMVDVTVSNP
jgi:hypothetical protein